MQMWKKVEKEKDKMVKTVHKVNEPIQGAITLHIRTATSISYLWVSRQVSKPNLPIHKSKKTKQSRQRERPRDAYRLMTSIKIVVWYFMMPSKPMSFLSRCKAKCVRSLVKCGISKDLALMMGSKWRSERKRTWANNGGRTG